MSASTFVAFPQKAEESIHVRAVARRLGATSADASSVADYLIMHFRDAEPILPARVLQFFRTKSNLQARQLIVIPSSQWAGESAKDDNLNDGTFILADSNISSLSKLTLPDFEGSPRHGLKAYKLRKLFFASIGAEKAAALSAIDKDLLPHFRDCWSALIKKDLSEGELDHFYYSLSLLIHGVKSTTHDLAEERG